MIVYHAIDEFIEPLRRGLPAVDDVYGELLVTSESRPSSRWAQNIWLEPQEIAIDSISDGARKLRKIQKHWCLYSFHIHRRAQLIAEQVFTHKNEPTPFPHDLPIQNLGTWTLIDANTILASPICTSPFANGVVKFVENKHGAPSRAYLKLWEALTICGTRPKPEETCLDLGASPGGWTWVLTELGANVVAIDKSPLEPKLMNRKNVTFRKGDAFSVSPDDFGSVDWLCCDVICYPDKLFEYIKCWVESGKCRNFVVTLKFQGVEHYDAIESFATLPGQIRHLYHNKHELTWISVGDNAGGS
jgi:23S rRNA (cytidine2498-2'-O)-methyltransferase